MVALPADKFSFAVASAASNPSRLIALVLLRSELVSKVDSDLYKYFF